MGESGRDSLSVSELSDTVGVLRTRSSDPSEEMLRSLFLGPSEVLRTVTIYKAQSKNMIFLLL